MIRKLLTTIIAIFGVSIMANAADPENTLYMDLKDGRVVIELRPDLAPTHVQRIKDLTRQGLYDGVPFHRVIEGFMAQTGDISLTGNTMKIKALMAEFNQENHVRGVVSMARTNDPNSAVSQFFIMLADAPHLDNQYTAWGKVTSGMEFVDKIKRGEPPVSPDKIVKMQVAADVRE